jgi:hypothetical protein
LIDDDVLLMMMMIKINCECVGAGAENASVFEQRNSDDMPVVKN